MPESPRRARLPFRLSFRAASCALALGASLSLAACASGGGSTTPTGTGTPARTGPTPNTEQLPSQQWPVKTREHVDLWLHGYAMLQADTARVPLFRRGYQERMRSLRRSQASTRLDANTERLRARLATNPELVNGQFVPLYFGSWDELRRAVDIFFQAQGNPNASGDPNVRTAIAIIAGAFPSGADREWLRTFVESLDDERQRFYHEWWLAQQRQRADAVTAVDSLWQRVYRDKFRRFLQNTQQAGGEILLSLTLDGEGRTVTLGEQRNAVAVGEPEAEAQAVEAIYVLAHEVVNAVTSVTLNDNTTPAEQRSGAVSSYAANVTVRGGAMLLQRIAPELVDGYLRYYLRAGGQSVPAGSLETAFAAAYPIPDTIRSAIMRQLEVVLGGI